VPLTAGGACIAAGGALLLDLQPHTSLVQLVVSYALLGCGFGLINPPITHTAVSGMPPERAGVASAITSASRQLGNVLGVAIMGSMVSATALGAGGLSGHAANVFTASTHLAWAVLVACGVGCSVIALACTGRRGLQAAARVYQEAPLRSAVVEKGDKPEAAPAAG